MPDALIAASTPPPSPDFLRSAVYLALDLRPQCPEAVALVTLLTQRILAAETGRRNQRRQTGLDKMQHAVGAIVGGLLRAWWSRAVPRPVRHSNRAEAFTPRTVQPDAIQTPSAGAAAVSRVRAAVVGRRQFKAVIDRLKADQLIVHKPGVRLPLQARRMGPKGQPTSARYWPTEALLRLAESQGLTPATIAAAFRAPPPPRVIRPRSLVEFRTLPAQRRRAGRSAARFSLLQTGVDRHRHETAVPPGVAEEVAQQNALAALVPVTFPADTPCYVPQWYRRFLGSWHLHGRWYAFGTGRDPAAGLVSCYASLKGAQRAQLRIGGERVVELDVGASHLTLLLGLLGVPMPEQDPYEGLYYPRPVVKQWILEVCGKGRPPTYWSKEFAAEAAAQGRTLPPIKAVGAAVLQRFPALAEPARVVPADLVAETGRPAYSLVTHYLTAQEVTAMSAAMRALREQNVLALPVHDSLIVPVRAETAARQAITAGYQAVCGVTPRLRDKAGAAL